MHTLVALSEFQKEHLKVGRKSGGNMGRIGGEGADLIQTPYAKFPMVKKMIKLDLFSFYYFKVLCNVF